MRFIIHSVVLGAVFASVGCFTRTALQSSGLLQASRKESHSDAATVRPAGLAGAQELPPKEAAAINLKMAENLEKEGMDADALLYYERARQLDRNLSDRVSRRLAVVYDKLDEQALAMKEYQELLQKSPKDSDLLADVAYSYYNRGQWVEAENYSRMALQENKNHRRGWMHLGMALGQQGRNQEALEAFANAVTAAEARSNLAFILAVRGKREEAIDMYRKALALEPMLKVARTALEKLESGASLADNPTIQAKSPAPTPVRTQE